MRVCVFDICKNYNFEFSPCAFVPRSVIPHGDDADVADDADDADVADDAGVADAVACAWVARDNGGKAGDDNSRDRNNGNDHEDDHEDDA